ncbi:MAG: alpha/beta fold hydrolase [Promethearchaeota archaeon]
MEFKEKQFDGPYEVIEIEINNKGEIFKGMLYNPPEFIQKPYPLVIYFHGFPQIFPLQEIAKSYKYILDLGFAFMIFNFRGYRYSDGEISIMGQFSDAIKIIEFVEKTAHNGIFDLENLNILAHDFGAFIALILCSKTKLINNLLLLSPILNIERHVNNKNFEIVLNYINRFLPGNVRGIDNVEDFIKKTQKELSKRDFKIETIIKRLKNKKLIIIIGEKDKITPLSEVNKIMKNSNLIPELVLIKGMDHQCIEDEDLEAVRQKIEEILKID